MAALRTGSQLAAICQKSRHFFKDPRGIHSLGSSHRFPTLVLPGTSLPGIPLHPKSSIWRNFPSTAQSCATTPQQNDRNCWRPLRAAEISVTICMSCVGLNPESLVFYPSSGLSCKADTKENASFLLLSPTGCIASSRQSVAASGHPGLPSPGSSNHVAP